MPKYINAIRLLPFGLFLGLPILSAAQTKITGTVWNDKLYCSPVPTEQVRLTEGVLKQTTGW